MGMQVTLLSACSGLLVCLLSLLHPCDLMSAADWLCRAAMRDMMSHSDSAAVMGKLHLELDHARAKEALARGALNRSELERLELERQTRALRQEVGRLNGQLAIQQDHAR